MFENFFPISNIVVFGNSLEAYGDAIILFVGVFVVLQIFRAVVLARLKALAKKTSTDIDDILVGVVNSVGGFLYFLIALGAGFQIIQYPDWINTVGYYLVFFVVVYALIKVASTVVDYLFERVIKKRLKEESAFDPSAIRLLGKGLKGAVWGVAFLLVLQNLGVDITALLAGLGIGGLAVAFALQSIFADIFASFSIYFDRPFQTGDFIIVGDVMGNVKQIGIKTTRLQSLWGEEIVIPNRKLTESLVKNYKQMQERRIVFSFGVTYDTPSAKLKKIPEIVTEIINGNTLAELNRVHFKQFADSSLLFEVMYVVKTSDYNIYMDVQQDINMQLKERLEAEKVEFAFPTQTVYLHKE